VVVEEAASLEEAEHAPLEGSPEVVGVLGGEVGGFALVFGKVAVAPAGLPRAAPWDALTAIRSL
jgi:hypothetical protein